MGKKCFYSLAGVTKDDSVYSGETLVGGYRQKRWKTGQKQQEQQSASSKAMLASTCARFVVCAKDIALRRHQHEVLVPRCVSQNEVLLPRLGCV